MELGAPSYLKRPADSELLQALLDGEYVFMLDSRQKGKSSLVVRTVVELRDRGITTVKLDLQRIGANVTPEQWYAGLLSAIGQDAGLTRELFAYWSEHQSIGPLARWIGAIEEVLLESTPSPIVIFVDEVDFVRALPFSTDEFFAGIRDCYNRRSEIEAFKRLTFCLVGVATPGQFIRSPDITPFNIGRRILLTDFSKTDLAPFATALSTSNLLGNRLVERVYFWTAGHPYLTQLLCSQIASRSNVSTDGAVDDLVEKLLFSAEARQAEPNLADVERRLLAPDLPTLSPEEARSQILEMHGLLLRRRSLVTTKDNPVVSALCLSGVAIENGSGIRLRNRVYRRVFDEKWRRNNMPDAELRRLRRAARLAITRTAGIAGVILVAMSSLAFGMWRLSGQRQQALQALSMRGKELADTAGERERALSALENRRKEISRVAGERAKALSSLEHQNEALKRLTQERQKALDDLVRQSGELEFQRYASNAYETTVMLGARRWERVSQLIRESASSPNRGWEWGHLALKVGYLERSERLPRYSVFEPQPNGELKVISPKGLHARNSRSSNSRQSWSQSSPYVPNYRSGPFRIVLTNKGRGNSIRDAKSGTILFQAPSYSMIFDVDATRGLFLMAESKSLETIQLRKIIGGKLIVQYEGPGETDSAKFLGDGTVLSAHPIEASESEEVRHWDSSGKTLDAAPWKQYYAHAISVSPDRKRYTVWGVDGVVELRSVQGHRANVRLVDHPAKVTALEFSRDGREILTGCEDGVMRVFSASTGELERSCAGHNEPVTSVAFLPNHRGWASMDESGLLRTWSDSSEPSMLEYKPHSKAMNNSYITADGRYLISASPNDSMASRNLRTGKVIVKSGEAFIARAQEANVIYQGRRDGTILVLDPKDFRIIKSRKIWSGQFLYLTLLSGGDRLVARGPGRAILLLDAHSLKEIARFEPKATRKSETENGVRIYDAIAFEKDGTLIADFRGDTGLIQVYSTQDGSLISQWDPGNVVLRMAFVNEGAELAACMGEEVYVDDGKTKIFDTNTGRSLREINEEGSTLVWLDYAPKTHLLGGMDAKGTIYLWDTATWRTPPKFRNTLAADIFFFSPDGTRVVASSSTGTVRFYDAFTGIERLALASGIPPAAPNMWGTAAQFSRDGKWVLLRSPDGWVRAWNSLDWSGSAKPREQSFLVKGNSHHQG